MAEAQLRNPKHDYYLDREIPFQHEELGKLDAFLEFNDRAVLKERLDRSVRRRVAVTLAILGKRCCDSHPLSLNHRLDRKGSLVDQRVETMHLEVGRGVPNQ